MSKGETAKTEQQEDEGMKRKKKGFDTSTPVLVSQSN